MQKSVQTFKRSTDYKEKTARVIEAKIIRTIKKPYKKTW